MKLITDFYVVLRLRVHRIVVLFPPHFFVAMCVTLLLHNYINVQSVPHRKHITSLLHKEKLVNVV
jgi:hypothetical protein